jgi:hypothetical protein
MPIGATTAAAMATPLVGGIANAIGAKKQREWMEKMWNLTNEYNSPAEQVKRMREAGLNPRLMYGTGSEGGGSTTQPGSYQRTNYQMAVPDVLGAINQMKDLEIKDAQIDKIKSETLFTDAKTLTEGINKAVKEAGRDLTNAQRVDLENRMNALSRKMEGDLSGYDVGAIQQYQKGASEVRSKFYKAELEKIIMDWATANQLNKIVAPFIIQMLRSSY